MAALTQLRLCSVYQAVIRDNEAAHFDSFERRFPCPEPPLHSTPTPTTGGNVSALTAWRDSHGAPHVRPGQAILRRPSATSRCPGTVQFCLCTPQDWSANLLERRQRPTAAKEPKLPTEEPAEQRAQCSPRSAPLLTATVVLLSYVTTSLVGVGWFFSNPGRSRSGADAVLFKNG